MNDSMFIDSYNMKTRADATMSNSIYSGKIVQVYSEDQTMDIVVQNNKLLSRIPINNSISIEGSGIRFMPVPGRTIALLARDINEYYHVGYIYNLKDTKYRESIGLRQLTYDKNYSKDSAVILQRYLDPGEVQIIALDNNEVYLSNDGGILIKDSNDSFISLDTYMGLCEGNFSNMQYEMDGVRIRAGNTIRPVTDAYENDFIVLKDGDVINEKDLEKDDVATDIKEFTVEVGTIQDPDTGIDKTVADGSPSVGKISLAERMVDEFGDEEFSASKSVNFKIKTKNGGGIVIDDSGSVNIVDYKAGSSTKFVSGRDGEKSLRVDQHVITINKDEGILIYHDSGASVLLNNDGEVIISNKDGRSLVLDENGFTIDQAEAYVTLNAKKNIFIGDCSFGGMALETLLPAQATAAFLDAWCSSHFHAGPIGPPVVPLLMTAQVMSGALQVSGIQVSI